MANLNPDDQLKLEKLFGMDGGHVITLTDKKLQDFVQKSVGLNVFDPKYVYKSNSRANRVRAIWKLESDEIVSKLISDLLKLWISNIPAGTLELDKRDEALYYDCVKIVKDYKKTVKQGQKS